MYDAIVLGLGAMGSSACYHLAKRGAKVLGIEQFNVGHDLGSSHGETRIIRRAYYEHPDYVPLLNRAYELWADLEKESTHYSQSQDLSERLFVRNGLVTFADPAKSEVYRGTLLSAEKYQIPVEKLNLDEAAQRFPYYVTREPSARALFEPDAGFLRVEKCVETHVTIARENKATVAQHETVLEINTDDPHQVTVVTNKNSYRAKKVVVAGGGWTSQILKDLNLPLKIHRLIQYWFKADKIHELKNFVPCFVFHLENSFFYGFPMLDGETIKIASHFSRDEIQDPREKFLAQVSDEKLRPLREFIRDSLPQVSDQLQRFATCIYTMTPDEHFIIDGHPQHRRIIFAGGFSGHGFKFSSVIGEILADLAENEKTRHPIDFLRLKRFKKIKCAREDSRW